MDLYEVQTTYCSLQRQFVVAESYAEVEELWMKAHKVKPKKITFVSPYIIISSKLTGNKQ